MTKVNAKSAQQHIAYAIPFLDKIRSRVMQAKIKGTREDQKYRLGCTEILGLLDRIETNLDKLSAHIVETHPDIGAPEDE